MRPLRPCAVLLCTAVATAACAGADGGSEPEKPREFGRTVALAHRNGDHGPVFPWSGTADAFYRVEDVDAQPSGAVRFTLAADLPALGRPLGFGDFSVSCTAEYETSTADHEELPTEVFGGLFEIPMECSVPEGSGFLIVTVDHADKTAEFVGPL